MGTYFASITADSFNYAAFSERSKTYGANILQNLGEHEFSS